MTGRKIDKNSKLQKCLRFIETLTKASNIIPQFYDVREQFEMLHPEYFVNKETIERTRTAYNGAVRIFKRNITKNNKNIKTKKDVLTKAKDAIEERITINPMLATETGGKTVVIDVNGDKAFFKVSGRSRADLIELIKDQALEEKSFYLKRNINQYMLHDEIIDESRDILKNQKTQNDSTKILYIEKIGKIVK